MNETEREPGSVPGGGGATSKRWLLLAAPAVVLASLLAVVVVHGRGAAPQRPPGTQGARGEPGEYLPSSPTATPSGPVPAFAGMTPSRVTDAWVKRWPGPVTVDGSLHTIRVTLPGTQDQLSAAVGQPNKDRRDEVAHVFCMVRLHGAVRRPLLKALVEGCLGPVLKAKERTAVLDWLISADFSVPHYQSQRSSRFELLANHNSDENFALILNAR
ncbi:hypothetical protein ABT023_10090 [Micromonospora sp. NPDC002296]|uniref:hypothetical protein n=1 Tax=Micromonospora sp. NPDC002296 TaxID=3154271 RepID=UPI003318D547